MGVRARTHVGPRANLFRNRKYPSLHCPENYQVMLPRLELYANICIKTEQLWQYKNLLWPYRIVIGYKHKLWSLSGRWQRRMR